MTDSFDVVRLGRDLADAAAPLSRRTSGTPAASKLFRLPEDRRPKPHPSRAPTAFVSWAHSDENWSSAQTTKWTQTVSEFTSILRGNGIDADIDLYHQHENPDWSRFGPDRIQNSDFVIIAISTGWKQRWAGTNRPTLGAGAVGEADTIKGLFQENQADWQRKFSIVLLPGQSDSAVPPDLRRLTRYPIDPDDASTLDPLLRALTDQPMFPVPELGSVPTLPAAFSRGLKVRGTGQQRDYREYEAVRSEVARLQKVLSEQPQRKEDVVNLAFLQGMLDALNA